MEEQEDPLPEGRPLGRKAFVGTLGVGLSALLWGDSALRLVAGVTEKLPASVQAVVPPVGGQWRIYAINPPYPGYDEATWKLTIDGLVDKPVEYSMADLRAMELAEQTSDFYCVTGWTVRGVEWRGVRFDTLLAEAGLKPEATALEFISEEEPYVDTLTLKQLEQQESMLALDMDGEPIRREHGWPARVVVPRMYGYKGVKWLARITATDKPEPGYWQQRGYSLDGWIDGTAPS
ncbi:MAG: molybdopterin-dependent oxidoreductase [Solirubrobacterales bacterium]|nr:molybdopterin-dependent oxidoreductase [Solirubrobacterales bacterium]